MLLYSYTGKGGVQDEFSYLYYRVSNISSDMGPRNLNVLYVAETEKRQIF